MTDNEILTALITIKRGIYSKPIKAYINTLISDIKSSRDCVSDSCAKQVLKVVDKHCYKSATSYRLVQESFTYGQKTPLKIDVEI